MKSRQTRTKQSGGKQRRIPRNSSCWQMGEYGSSVRYLMTVYRKGMVLPRAWGRAKTKMVGGDGSGNPSQDRQIAAGGQPARDGSSMCRRP